MIVTLRRARRHRLTLIEEEDLVAFGPAHGERTGERVLVQTREQLGNVELGELSTSCLGRSGVGARPARDCSATGRTHVVDARSGSSAFVRPGMVSMASASRSMSESASSYSSERKGAGVLAWSGNSRRSACDSSRSISRAIVERLSNCVVCSAACAERGSARRSSVRAEPSRPSRHPRAASARGDGRRSRMTDAWRGSAEATEPLPSLKDLGTVRANERLVHRRRGRLTERLRRARAGSPLRLDVGDLRCGAIFS